MKWILLPSLLLMFSTSLLGAGPSPSFITKLQEKLRPLVSTVLGEKIATRFFGSGWSEEVEMPTIPQVVRDAKAVNQRMILNEKQLSDEVWRGYNTRFVREIYEATRRLRPNANDIAQWTNVLNQGGTHEGVYRALVLDQTYAGLENYPEPMNEALVSFSHEYFKKYLNRERSEERLRGVNFYSIKRILAEGSLEVLDVMRATPDDFYRWYAHFSGEMAHKYPEALVDEMRIRESMNWHYHWAQNAPEQLIKAEFLIKLHLVMNFLQGSP